MAGADAEDRLPTARRGSGHPRDPYALHNGNPRAGNLSAILKAVGRNVGVQISVHAVPTPEPVTA